MNWNRHHHSKRKIFFFILLVPALFLGIGAVVMLLWNAILPSVIHVTSITYMQALGILVLSKILFSGFRHVHSGRHMHPNGKFAYLRQKWENMTDEEKAKYKEDLKNCCHPNKP